MKYNCSLISDKFRNWLWEKHGRELFGLMWQEFVKFAKEFSNSKNASKNAR